MTVGELIEVLRTMPQDYIVVHRYMSDFDVLDAADIEVAPPESKKVVRHHNMPGRVREAGRNETHADADFVAAVIFPGN